MSFSSLFFVFTWLPIIYALYALSPKRLKNAYLVIVSLLFYSWGDPKYVILLIFCILVNYGLGIWINNSNGHKRKSIFLLSLIINVFILAYFKYYGFMLDTIFNIIPVSAHYEVLAMPLGISFFTFQILAYQIDVYRKKIEAQRNFIDYALYVSFFPKLIMGPITPYAFFEEQLKNHKITRALLDKGAKRFIIGLAQKVILANTFAVIWNSYCMSDASLLGAWIGILAYTLQIYFDFCGYSHMAIGLANMFGFQLVENFNYPYVSQSISEFWRRWHISLGAWFREYIYIPLGGNRVSRNKHIRNLMIVWLLTGIWHGASFNFIIWGVYYGVLVVLEKHVFASIIERIPMLLRWICTFILVVIGWVFFATPTLSAAFAYLGRMGNIGTIGVIDNTAIWYLKSYLIYFIIAIFACTPLLPNLFKMIARKRIDLMHMVMIALLILLFFLTISFMVNDTYTSFLYFDF